MSATTPLVMSIPISPLTHVIGQPEISPVPNLPFRLKIDQDYEDVGDPNIGFGPLIDALSNLNQHVSVAIAMFTHGLDPIEARIDLRIFPDEINQVKALLDTHIKAYKLIIGEGKNQKIYSKPKQLPKMN